MTSSYLDFTSPNSLDINNGVAGATSKAEKQDNGMIGSIGYNYNIFPGPIAATLLPPFSRTAVCENYYFGNDSDSLLMEKMNSGDSRKMRQKTACSSPG